jgi:hypothetical protein
MEFLRTHLICLVSRLPSLRRQGDSEYNLRLVTPDSFLGAIPCFALFSRRSGKFNAAGPACEPQFCTARNRRF